MLSIPGFTSVAAAAFDHSAISDHFSKGGRKIRVGDCALFQPAQDSPPFIGIIREVASRKKESIWLAVNWIYRPADVKLARGALVEAAPNEVFFSFHKDEIPAASLLHPCKVAFLGKGVGLPSVITSYVCRRVYDIENKCLWWLTDKDYIKEQQEEVRKLLDKTRLEMDGEVQSGGRSPKPSNHSHFKPNVDSIKSCSSLLSSQVKGKKREHGDHTFVTVKHERTSKTYDEDNGPENKLTSQVAKFTQKGGLVDFEGVRKLVKLMHPEGAEMKVDLVGRIMLVNVISATNSFDCLGRFVQLRGLPLLDEWLQEVRRGKIGGGSSPKESDESVDVFLLAILRALEKLPVNLHSLQTCNVGKSVNYLRSHRNSEIQRKARSLVDIWKKRVEAEMNVIDAKPGLNRTVSWPSKPVPSEVSNAWSNEMGCTKEAGVKNSVQQHATSRSHGHNLSTSEAATNVQAACTGSTKSPMSVVGFNSEESNSNMSGSAGNLDPSLPPIKEEKSSGSSQSQNTSQSGSGNHVNLVGSSLREDARSSTARSGKGNNLSNGASLHRKSSSGTIGTVASGVQKKLRAGKSCRLIRNVTFEEGLPNGVKPDKITENVDHVNSNQRLIVRLPNTGRSSAPIAREGSVEEPTVKVKASPSSANTERPGHQDRKSMAKGISERAMTVLNAEFSNSKDDVNELDKGNVSLADSLLDEQRRETEDCEILKEASKAILSSETALESVKSFEASFNSINALVDSCVKISEASASASLSDDVGINLLASVAAGEISKFSTNLPFVSGLPVTESTFSGSKVKLESSNGDIANAQGEPIASVVHQALSEKIKIDNGQPKPSLLGGRNGAQVITSNRQISADNSFSAPDVNHSGETHDTSMVLSSMRDMRGPCSGGEGSNNFYEKINFALKEGVNEVLNNLLGKDNVVNHADATTGKNSVTGKVEAVCRNIKVSESIANNAAADSGLDVTGDLKNHLDEEPNVKPRRLKSQDGDIKVDVPFHAGVASNKESPGEKANIVKTEGHITESGSATEHNSDCARETSDRNVIVVVPREVSSPENGHCLNPSGCKLDGVERNETDNQRNETDNRQASSVKASLSPTIESAASSKLDFDLNEGFPVDDEVQVEHVKSLFPVNSSPLRLSCPLSYPLSSMPEGVPTSITVTAAAKGPFVHLESLPRTKGELGWKGSAATSAFRPAEPRKIFELPLSTTATVNTDSTTGKRTRPTLDIDLNVADERCFDDIGSPYPAKRPCTEFRSCDQSVSPAGGLDFDLNSVGECPDTQQSSMNSRGELGNLSFLSGLLPSSEFSNGKMVTSRNFDLNNGPRIDEVGTETAPLKPNTRNNVPFPSQVPGITMSYAELGNISSWYPPVNSYSPVTVPSFLPSRGEQNYAIPTAGGPQRIFVPSVNGEMFRGVLSSTTAFSYPGYPFEASFPVTSNSFSGSSGGAICFPAIPSQLEGSTNAVPSHYPRPYLMGLPGGTAAVGHENRKWGNQGLDLNSGPRSTEIPPAMRPINVGSPSPAQANEQLHMYQMAGGMFKRKEPDSGWDMSTDRYKHP